MHSVDVTRCLDEGSISKESRKELRADMVAWLEEHVGEAQAFFADGTATKGNGWKFVSKDRITDSEPIDLGMGKVSWKHTYKAETRLVFEHEIDAICFKLKWSDSL